MSVAPAAADQFETLDEIYSAAREKADSGIWAHLDGGAGEESTVRANREAFRRWQFRPRVLTGIEPPDTSTTFAGLQLSMPILTGAFGSDQLYHPDGQVGVARAAARAGTMSIIPGASSFSLEHIGQAAPAAAKIFQLHSVGTDGDFLELAARAKDAGYELLCVTVDMATRGWRDRMRRARFTPDVSVMSGNYSTEPSGHLTQVRRMDVAIWTWNQLADVCARAGMPFLVKGILTAEDAQLAVEAGAAGILVSNHGGRQIDGAPASLDQLPEIVEQVGGKCSIALDSGIRRGTDVLKALALGAQVVVIGRAAAMGIIAAGEEGAYAVLKLMHGELMTTMALTGRGNIQAIDRTLVQPNPSFGFTA